MKSFLRIVLLCLGCFIFTFGQDKTDVYPLEKAPWQKEMEALVPCKVDFEEYSEVDSKESIRTELVLLLRAKCFKQLNKISEMLKEISTLLSLNPNLSEYFQTGIIALLKNEKGNYQINNIDSLVNSNPTHPFPAYVRVICLTEQEKYKEAIEDGLKYVDNFTFNYEKIIKLTIQNLIAIQDDKDVIDYYKRAYKFFYEKLMDVEQKRSATNAGNLDLYTLRYYLQNLCNGFAATHRKIGDFEKENEILENSLWTLPKWRAYQIRRQYYLDIKDTQKAEQDFISSIELQIEEKNKAIAQTDEALRKALIYIEIGNLYLQIKRYDEAKVNFDNAKTLVPDIYIPPIPNTNKQTCVPGIPCPQNNPTKP